MKLFIISSNNTGNNPILSVNLICCLILHSASTDFGYVCVINITLQEECVCTTFQLALLFLFAEDVDTHSMRREAAKNKQPSLVVSERRSILRQLYIIL
jgi:hypothetical protein